MAVRVPRENRVDRPRPRPRSEEQPVLAEAGLEPLLALHHPRPQGTDQLDQADVILSLDCDLADDDKVNASCP